MKNASTLWQFLLAFLSEADQASNGNQDHVLGEAEGFVSFRRTKLKRFMVYLAALYLGDSDGFLYDTGLHI